MIKCKQFTEQIHAYLDGDKVPQGSRMGMWMHQMLCSHCRRYMQQIQDVIKVGETLEREEKKDFECSDDFKSDLLENYKKTNPNLGK